MNQPTASPLGLTEVIAANLAFGANDLTLAVTDTGRSGHINGTGHGLVGIRGRVADGGSLFAPSVTRRLTERETAMLRCLARGHSNTEIYITERR